MDKRKHSRFAKKLAIKFFVHDQIFKGVSVNLSERGLFINVNKNFAIESSIDIELLLPDNKTAFLKGIIKRTSKNTLSSATNGIGIQIVENHKTFVDFVKSTICRKEGAGSDDHSTQKTGSPRNLNKGTGDKSVKSSADEKRQYSRFSAGKMNVTTEIASANQAVIINICKGGMLVKSDRRFHVGKSYSMKIGYKGKSLSVKACAMWALLIEGIVDTYGNHIPFYLTGMQFIDDIKTIAPFITLIESDAQAGMMQLNNVRKMSPAFMGVQQREIASDKKQRNGSLQHDCENIAVEPKRDRAEEILKNKKIAGRYFENGKLHFWNGQYRQAEFLFRNAVHLHNTCSRYYAFYARTLLKLQKFDDAESAIRKALENDPENSDYYVDAGDIYHAMDQPEKAGENYEMALRFRPSNMKAHKALFRLKKKIEDRIPFNKNPLRAFRKMVVR